MLRRLAIALLVLIAPLAAGNAVAGYEKFSKAELDQLLAPVALYPDDLLASILVAATYPLEVVQAARWRAEPENAKLKGEALAKALEEKDWDPSVKSLVQVSDLLKKMSDELEWTERLGNAVLAQQAEVMDEVQFLRRKSEEAGSLATNRHQKVSRDGDEIIIEPAEPDVVYVPVYETSQVYGPWWSEDYPPYDWTWSGAPLANGFYWGAGAVIASAGWAWGNCNWRRHDIDIDVNKWNSINVNRPKVTDTTWAHDPAHRGAAPYKGEDVRNRFQSGSSARGQASDRPRGFDMPGFEQKLKEGAAKHGRARDLHEENSKSGKDGKARTDARPRQDGPNKGKSAAHAKTTGGANKAAGVAKAKSSGVKGAGGPKHAANPRPTGARGGGGAHAAAMAKPGRAGGGGHEGGGRRGGGRR